MFCEVLAARLNNNWDSMHFPEKRVVCTSCCNIPNSSSDGDCAIEIRKCDWRIVQLCNVKWFEDTRTAFLRWTWLSWIGRSHGCMCSLSNRQNPIHKLDQDPLHHLDLLVLHHMQMGLPACHHNPLLDAPSNVCPLLKVKQMYVVSSIKTEEG